MEMLTRIYVPLNESERKALNKLGLAEKRDSRAQAAIIIRRELERLGLLERQLAIKVEIERDD